ncbi:hypothetical protein EVA_16005 [gut metagenome]|uniref:Uncharacterized protein n=1 Tax=gut metagenome TaxID=749906 RepID=J9G246_9ZZZZ
MRPTGSIHLTGWDTHRTQSRYRKRRFLTTTAICRAHGSQRRTGTSITRTINHFLMTPVIHLHDSVFHRKPLHPLFQLCIKHLARIIQIFIIHTHRQHKMTEQFIGHNLSPRHLLASLLSQTDIFQIVCKRIVRYIPHRHISIQKHQSLLLRQRKRSIRNPGKQIAIRKCFLLLLIILKHLIAVGLILQKMRFSTRK